MIRLTTTLCVIAGMSSTAFAGVAVVPRQASSSVPTSAPSAPSTTPAAAAATSTTGSAAASVPTISQAGGLTTNIPPGPQITPTFFSTGPSAIPLASITASVPTAQSDALHPTLIATPGATPPIPGAPPLPSWAFVPGSFPALDLVPDTNSSQVALWIQEVANSGVTIPDIAPTIDSALCASNPQAAATTSNCWWTCGGCVRDTDITTCPDKDTWGVSYDDGPSPYTPDLLNFLDDNQLKSTFFIVGSRAISRPQILQAEYMAGHQLSVHTWSHPPLTTLTNEQIIAELGWTREAIRQITGVSPNTMRPPYGDIDDRVRAICHAMGMTPIIWSSYNGVDFDTNDWHIPSGFSVDTVVEDWDTILDTAATSLNTGFIVLSHDLYQQTVELATGYLIPDALARRNPQFNLMSIIECQHKPLGDAYTETNNNQTNPFSSNANPLTGSVAITATPGGTASAAGTAASSATTTSSKKSAAGRSAGFVGLFEGLAVVMAGVAGALVVV